jgi:hypothetical protein
VLCRAIGRSLACSVGGMLLASSPALAAAPHGAAGGDAVVDRSREQPDDPDRGRLQRPAGGCATRRGATVYVPTVEEGAAAPPAAPAVESSSSTAAGDSAGRTSVTTIAPAPGMGDVPSPYGELHLALAAADAWNRMRAEALGAYGIDTYPGGDVRLPHRRPEASSLRLSRQRGAGPRHASACAGPGARRRSPRRRPRR